MAIDSKQLREEIIRPTLKMMGAHSESAENLVFGTAAHESHCGTYVKQVSGPALGIYQMEPATYEDIWRNYLTSRTRRDEVLSWGLYGVKPPAEAMVYDMRLATIMCRLHYMRFSEALPQADDLQGLAEYWKKYYNTKLGKGTPDKFISDYKRFS